MKPGEPLKRTPMPPRTTPMPRGSLRSKPSVDGSSTPAKRKTGKHVGESKARRGVRKRSGGDCEIRSPWCQGAAREFSHRIAEGQGGKWLVINGLDSCGHGNLDGCHGYAHQHPEEAREKGWIVSAFGADLTKVKVLMWHDQRQDWFLLREDGGVDLAPWPEGKTEHPDDLESPRPDPGLGGAA